MSTIAEWIVEVLREYAPNSYAFASNDEVSLNKALSQLEIAGVIEQHNKGWRLCECPR